VLTLWHGSRREWRRLLELAPLALVSIAVYLPWFIACARAMGSENFLYELYAQNFARFVAADRGHGKPIHYYLVNIWGDLAPWSLLLPFALWWVYRGRARRDRHVQLLLWWFGAFFVFLSLAATKRQLYLVPAYPAIAVLLGLWIAAVLRAYGEGSQAPSPRPVRAHGLAAAALLAVVGVALVAAGTGIVQVADPSHPSPNMRQAVAALRTPVVVLGVAAFAGGLWIGTAAARRRPRAVLVRTVACHVLIYLILLGWVLPAANPIKSTKTQGRWIRQQMGDATHMGLVFNRARYGFRKMGSFGLYADARVELLESAAQVDRFFEVYPHSIVLIEQDEVDGVFRDDADAWADRIVRDLWIGNDHYIVVRGP
jgi:4-amino-4-deoxy-L-arabinose transferase-like glycosyltransferase